MVVVLLMITTGLAYKFIVQGDVIEINENRLAIRLNEGERTLVLSEMRVFLQSVQQITQSIAEDDMAAVVSAARSSGRSAQAEVPGSLVGKLPLPFKKLGFDTHAKFDELALDAEQLGDRDHALTQLSVLLQNCVSCHATFRFSLETEKSD